MSAGRNTEAVSNQMPSGGSGEFHSSVERDEPLTTHGVSSHPNNVHCSLLTAQQHKPGVLVGNDAAPEFSAQTLPAGSAPESKTFQPQNDADIPPPQQGVPQASATDFPGATSGDVNTGLGKPVQGQTSNELRHDTQRTGGLDGLKSGAQGKTVDAHDPLHADQRALDKDEAVVGRSDVPSAEERIPESSESVSAERK